jgi:tRNA-binding protein
MDDLSWDEFQRVDLRVGTVTRVEDFPEAHSPAYKIWADFGEEIGVLKSSAQVTDLYVKEQLIGRQILGVVNFPSKQIGPFTSEFLVTGFHQENGNVVLAVPDSPVPNGSTLA